MSLFEQQDQSGGLETFVFRGQTRYKCPESGCGFDSYLPSEVAKHWKKSHLAEQAGAGGNSAGVLFDANDEPIPSRKIDVPDGLKEFFR